MFEIKKDVPVPTKATGDGKNAVIIKTLDKLEVGESFEVPADYMKRARLSSTITAYTKKNELKEFQTSKLENGAVGVWRVK